jgi:hypothetical protein
MNDVNWITPGAQILAIREAIATVALSHADDCTCDVCRAAHGDDKALAKVIDSVEKSREG